MSREPRRWRFREITGGLWQLLEGPRMASEEDSAGIRMVEDVPAPEWPLGLSLAWDGFPKGGEVWIPKDGHGSLQTRNSEPTLVMKLQKSPDPAAWWITHTSPAGNYQRTVREFRDLFERRPSVEFDVEAVEKLQLAFHGRIDRSVPLAEIVDDAVAGHGQLEDALVEHREALNDLAAEIYGNVSRYGWTSAKTLVAKALERLQEKPPRGRPFRRG